MTRALLSDHLRAGDHIVVGQLAGEPVGLVDELFRMAPTLGHLEVFCGFSLDPSWGTLEAEGVRVTTYCGLGTVRKLVAQDRARVVPASLSHLSSMIASGRMPVDVVLLQVSPADADGYHSLGCTLDYVWEAARVARVVLVEVNTLVPATRGAARLHKSEVVAALHSDTSLPEAPAEVPDEIQRRVAVNAARLVPDGAAIQLGIGSLAVAVAEALRDHRGLRLRSGMVGDWYLDLLESGALDVTVEEACRASLAVGSRRLYDALSRDHVLQFAPPSDLVRPLPNVPLIAVNSAIEVDLTGQANTEFLGQRYVGTIGGQPDYFRAARLSADGLAVLALPSVANNGKSRIVEKCVHVSTAQSDVDVIVTEHGMADIRGTTLAERRALIAAIADPALREELGGSASA
ncbi:acetyl-CoA hydrolase/transferase family protein [Martelella sp. AMO21009]